LASAGAPRILWELIHANLAFHFNPPPKVSTMSRNLTSLALSASLLLMSSVALAQSTDPACSLADKEMLTSLHFENAKPTLERKEVPGTAGSPATTVTLCKVTSSQDGVIRSLITSSAPFPAGVVMPPNCSAQPVGGMQMQLTMCLATAKGAMVNAMLMEKNDDEGKRLATVLRAHFERRIKELNK
jgi:hypothetical protein